jgi:putative ABC transport system substrate-binding protein
MNVSIGRRRFLSLLGGAVAAWPVPSYAQQAAGVRKIGFLMGLADDAEAKARIEAFEQGLAAHGWRVGADLQIEHRFAAGNPESIKAFARELAGLRPDLIVTHSTPVTREVVKVAGAIPIVFVVVADPIGSGFAKSFARPGGRATGFTNLAAPITGKLLTVLKQIAPHLDRIALMFNPNTVARGGMFYLRPFETAAPSFGIQPIPAQARTPGEIERVMSELARTPGGGLIVTPDNFTTVNRHLIISLAAKLRIPTIYPYRYFVEDGGLVSYGVDAVDLFRRAADYVSRILLGADPAYLPVQTPTKFELVINMKTARALGLSVPKILRAAANDLVE